MKSIYRLVYFTPRPWDETRIPVAALVTDGATFRVARAEHVPGADCIGGVASAMTLDLLRSSLAEARDPTSLLAAIGPHAELGAPLFTPSGVKDAVKWLEEFVLPRRVGDEGNQPRERSVQRATEGWRFFEKWGLSLVVGKNFRPGKMWKEVVGAPALTLPRVSHWVGHSKKVMLLEPIVPGRLSFDEDVDGIGTTFAAYRWHLREHHDINAELVAYALPGTPAEKMSAARARLEPSAHEVVDLSTPTERAKFVGRIRSASAAANPELH